MSLNVNETDFRPGHICPDCGGRIGMFADYVMTFDCKFHTPIDSAHHIGQIQPFKSGPIPASEYRDGLWRDASFPIWRWKER